MLATMFQEDGSPFEGDPRQVLNKVYQRFRAMGLRPVMATELEFYVLDGESSSSLRPLPPRLGGDQGPRLSGDEGYSVVEMDGFADFLAELRSACDTQGIPADTVISEMGPGQFEINLNHIDNPLIAADHAILFKRLVKGVAQKHGLAATFMAKPYADCSGNGFHCHFSLVDDEGNNVFDDGTDAGSDMLKYAIAGLMQTMGDSMLCFAPHMNSYRRFMEGSHAPTFATWGYENRTVAIRVPDSPGLQGDWSIECPVLMRTPIWCWRLFWRALCTASSINWCLLPLWKGMPTAMPTKSSVCPIAGLWPSRH